MSEKKEVVFAEGFHCEEKDVPGVPWLKARISVRVNDAVKFLEEHANPRGFVNINVKESKKGGWYCELDTWEPNKSGPASNSAPADEIDSSSIPF